MVGNNIYENDSYLRAFVGNYRESRAMQFKKFEFFSNFTRRPFWYTTFKNRDNIRKFSLAKPRFCEKQESLKSA